MQDAYQCLQIAASELVLFCASAGEQAGLLMYSSPSFKIRKCPTRDHLTFSISQQDPLEVNLHTRPCCFQVEIEETRNAEAEKMASSEAAIQGRLRDAQRVIAQLQSTTTSLQVHTCAS